MGSASLRLASATLAGFLAFFVIPVCGHFAALSFWPDYAAAFPSRAFTLPMLLSRHTAGLLGTIAAGYVASSLSRQDRRPPLWLAGIGLVINIPAHLTEPVWSNYPPWYHFVFFAYLLFGPLFGGWLNRRTAAIKN